ncbi:hypothetical protein [uncultured Alloprevotella sp.]|uniref:hypothetical protein n=1 Tax=uncultured Alloprevotella sp. TaxID=1283315 RepID=UPI00260A544B|nr:hypothetical protein [uncultured Alloprevotella sp.]
MKKILLGAVLCLFCALQMSAQSYNEDQLEGVWELAGDGGDYNDYIGSITKMKIGDQIRIDKGVDFYSGFIEFKFTNKMKELEESAGYESSRDMDDEKILDYFITGNDRLHLIVGDQFSLHFKIVELDGHTMKLQTKKGIMTFNKTATNVQNIAVETGKSEQARYNIKGQRITRPEKGINIVRMSDNSSRKEFVR